MTFVENQNECQNHKNKRTEFQSKRRFITIYH